MKHFSTSTIALLALLTLLSGAAQAQATAAPAKSTDPIVQMRSETRDANAAYSAARREARKEREVKVLAAEEAAVKQAQASGKDPLVARRVARKQALAETLPAYKERMRPATEARNKARTDARAAAAPAKN